MFKFTNSYGIILDNWVHDYRGIIEGFDLNSNLNLNLNNLKRYHIIINGDYCNHVIDYYNNNIIVNGGPFKIEFINKSDAIFYNPNTNEFEVKKPKEEISKLYLKRRVYIGEL